jgi:hypothetical protein
LLVGSLAVGRGVTRATLDVSKLAILAIATFTRARKIVAFT